MLTNAEKEIKLVMVSQKADDNLQTQQLDPLQQQIISMKLTANLLKQMSFNSSINKFDYFQKLLEEENKKFNNKIERCMKNQKQILKKIKILQKCTKEIKNQSSVLKYAKVHIQLQQLKTTKQQTIKYQKVSQGMLKYLQQIDQRLNQC